MNILLDLDGTLTDPSEGFLNSLRFAMTSMQIPLAEDDHSLTRYIGPPIENTFRQLVKAESEAQVQHAVALYRQRYAEAGWSENVVYEGIPEVLQVLVERGGRLYLATSKLQKFAIQILQHFELDQYFSGMYGSAASGALADKSQLLAHILQQEGLDPRECVMVGDTRYDVLGAKAHDMRVISVLWGHGQRDDLLQVGTDCLVERPAELVAAIFRD